MENIVRQPIPIVQHAKNKPPNLSITPEAPSGHGSLGLFTPNTPSMILEPIDLQESEVEVISDLDRHDTSPTSETPMNSQQLTSLPSSVMATERRSLPTPPSTPLPKPNGGQSVVTIKISSNTSLVNSSDVSRLPKIITCHKSHPQPVIRVLNVGPPPSLPARLIRTGKSVTGPRPQPRKPSNNGYVPSPLRPSLSNRQPL